jgi:hypothetical protein
MGGSKPDPRAAIKLLLQLKGQGLDDDAFRQLHHLGDTIGGFCSYAQGKQHFREEGNNHRVHKRLLLMKLWLVNGVPPQGESFATLAQRALREIPKK